MTHGVLAVNIPTPHPSVWITVQYFWTSSQSSPVGPGPVAYSGGGLSTNISLLPSLLPVPASLPVFFCSTWVPGITHCGTYLHSNLPPRACFWENLMARVIPFCPIIPILSTYPKEILLKRGGGSSIQKGYCSIFI